MVYIRRLYFVPGRPGTSFFDAICEMDNIVLAHKLASRGKSWYSEVKMVNSDPEFYLANIQWMLINQDFTTSAYDTVFDMTALNNEPFTNFLTIPIELSNGRY